MYRGKMIGEYIYDGWGNCEVKELSISNDIDRCVLYYNPFRYKGYYYDVETGLFYCNSRYYSPELCCWISPDSIEYLDPESVNGLNLYCYCFNNPINYADPNGHFPWLILVTLLLFTPVGGIVTQAAASTIGYVVTTGWAVGDLIFNNGDGAWSDMCSIKWNLFNTDENKVMVSNNVSFYKGVPVFQISGMGGSMSLGAIFIDKSQGVEVLNHERGHNTQLMSMGLGNYLIQIGIPSVWKNGDETPWELSASMLGGSDLANGYSEEQKRKARNYYIRAMIPIVNIYNIFQYIFY
ncbi:MAG: RHS repeat-associated core domain-containing protein [Prevotella sp.]|nr:RHS repeat-associated core domain-containing protein [Staphylococcus sp.]MCM1350697.1 RHS repeat-associated core domain-containing protein [Prevotella sp.]